MPHVAARAAAAAIAPLSAPRRSFASDNTAGAPPVVLEAISSANVDHAGPYGQDRWSAQVEERFADLFGAPVPVALCFGGTGANVVALHTMCTRDSHIVCTADAHIVLDEADAPEHITGASLVTYPWNAEGKLTPMDIDDAVARSRRTHIGDVTPPPYVVSVTQATEVGTVYRPDELSALCDAAHAAGMTVHVDGARLTNALVSWGFAPQRMAEACRTLRATGVDVVCFGGTKAGLLGAEAVLFLNSALATPVLMRRKQTTQTASKMRFLAAQFLAGLDDGRLLAWSTQANLAAQRLAGAIESVPGAEIGFPVDANAVFVRLPADAVAALQGWTPFHVWDPAQNLVRFVTSWDTTEEDVDRLAAGIQAAVTASTTALRQGSLESAIAATPDQGGSC